MNNRPVILGAVLVFTIASIAYLQSISSRPRNDNSKGGESVSLVIPTSTSTDTCGPSGKCTSTKEIVSSSSASGLANTKKNEASLPLGKEITNPSGFVNVSGIKLQDIVGKKVILVDFWTYSCINCQRTLPYINAWYEKYHNEGLEIVGIHTPEFEFEKIYDNVKAAVARFGIKYPVVLDNDYGTWAAYGNRYWPRKYLIDINGRIVYDHIGEGGYDETERKIQELLTDRMKTLGESGSVATDIVAPKNASDTNADKVGSPETYFGSARNQLANGISGVSGEQTLTIPSVIVKNGLYLGGTWNIGAQSIENKTNGAKITYRYQAKHVYIVGSSVNGVTVKVLRDGKSLGAEKGGDVKSDSSLTIKEDRLYELVNDPGGYGEHTLELIIDQPGFRAFTFTFG